MPEPLLYLSAYFEKHLSEYYGGILAVSQKSDWCEWMTFFLQAVVEQADETIKSIQKLMLLKKNTKKYWDKKILGAMLLF